MIFKLGTLRALQLQLLQFKPSQSPTGNHRPTTRAEGREHRLTISYQANKQKTSAEGCKHLKHKSNEVRKTRNQKNRIFANVKNDY